MVTPASFTKTFHNRSYPAISPSRKELSCKDKTVIITGAGQGIGAATARSFAQAGATKIALIGRTESKLQTTKSEIESTHSNVTVYIATADVSNPESLGRASHEIRVTLGAWDIFVHCAGVLGGATPLTGADIDEWWSAFETNTKFVAIFAKHFLTKCRLPGATFIYCNAGAAHVPAQYLPACSAYSASKLAAARLTEFLAKENTGLRVFSVHPGIVKTPLADEFIESPGAQPVEQFDEPELAGDFFVWCSSVESEFLRGRFVWANWDVEEMIQKKDELNNNPGLLTTQLAGWPFMSG